MVKKKKWGAGAGAAEEGGHYRMTSIMVEPEIYDEFLEIIPRRKSVGEALREYMKSVVEENRKQKNLSSPNYSALNLCNNDMVNTLDKYFPNHIIEWENFKTIVEMLPAEERKKLTEIWKHDFAILEMTNQRMDGRKVYPFIKGF